MIYCRKYLLKEIATVHSGYSIRGKIPEIPGGELKIIQMKDIDPEFGIDWDRVASINQVIRKKPDFLRENDIIFSGRGTKVFAVAADKPGIKTVAAPHFFVIKPMNDMVNARFLAWYVNQKPAQIYLLKNAGSSAIINVTRQVLEELPVILPSLQDQLSITQYLAAARKEYRIAANLYRKRNQLISALITSSIQEET